MRQITSSIALLALSGAAVAAATPITTPIVDSFGFQTVLFKALLGQVPDGATVSIQLQTGNAADGSDMANVSDGIASIGTAGDGKFLIAEVFTPREGQRYWRAVITRAGGNSDIVSIEAMLAGAANVPVAQPSIAAKACIIGHD